MIASDVVTVMVSEPWLKQALQDVMEDYKQTPAYARNCTELFRYVSLSDMATDLAPLLLKRLQ